MPASRSREALHRAAPLEHDVPASYRWSLVVGLSVATGALVVYLRTLAPSLPTGDSGELITAAWLPGIPHPPGYPLFTMLAHLFTLLPFGSPAYRVNLVSAIFGAAAAGLIGVCLFRLLSRDAGTGGMPVSASMRSAAALAAVTGGLLLAVSTPFWTYSVVAEVFALNSFFAALIILILVEWEHCPRRVRLLSAFGLTGGLAATNQQTIVLLAPACILLLASATRKLFAQGSSRSYVGSQLAIAAGLVLAGLLPYAYLPLVAAADPALNWGDPRTPTELLHVLTRADYGTLRLAVTDHPNSASPLEHVGILLNSLYRGFTPGGCALAVVGLWWLCARRRVVAVAVGLAFFCTGPLFVAYANPPIDNAVFYGVLERFYILPGLFVAVAAGAGVFQVAALRVVPSGKAAAAAAGLCLIAVLVAAMTAHYADVDQSTNVLDFQYGEDLLGAPEPGALFIVQGDVPTMAVDYLQLVEGRRPDVVAINLEKLKLTTYVGQMRRQHPELVIPFASYVPGGDQMASLVEANLPSRPVFVLGMPNDPGFTARFDVQRAGLVDRLLPRGSNADPDAFVERNLGLLRTAHYPTRTYPETTFESTIQQAYANLAFEVAYVLDDGVRDADAINFYRLVLQLDPTNAPAYKNLGRLLYNRGESASAVVPLWEEYLRLQPTDPEAPAIRERIREMRYPQ